LALKYRKQIIIQARVKKIVVKNPRTRDHEQVG